MAKGKFERKKPPKRTRPTVRSKPFPLARTKASPSACNGTRNGAQVRTKFHANCLARLAMRVEVGELLAGSERRAGTARPTRPRKSLLRKQTFLKPHRILHAPVVAHAHADFVEPELLVKRAGFAVF